MRVFAARLQKEAEQIDTDADVLAAWYAQFVAAELHEGWSTRQPLSGWEFCEALAILGAASGAFGFVVLQQFVANTNLADRVPEHAAWPCVGVAFGHLRNPRGTCPRWDGECVTGFIPWLTGAGIFPQVILGMRGRDNEEVYALADATDRPAFRHSKPLELTACEGTRTVSVQATNLLIASNCVLKRDPPGTFAHNDVQGVVYQTPLMVGCVRACQLLIHDSLRIGASEQARCERGTERLLQKVYAAFAGCAPEEGQQIRAELGDFTVRIARLTVMAYGGGGLARGHPAQRLYREALLYSLMAQTDAIVRQAFQEVFA